MLLKKRLHQDADKLLIGPKRTFQRIIVHSLIDLEYITSLTCAWESCVLPGVPLAASGRTLDGFTIDHIIAINDGGTDRPENIQLLHHTCNMRKGAIFTEERRAKIAEKTKLRWNDPAYRNAMATRTRSQEEHEHRVAGAQRGDDHWKRRSA